MGRAPLVIRNASIFETTSNVAFATKIGIALELVCQGSSLVAAAVVCRNGIDFDRAGARRFMLRFELSLGYRVLRVVLRVGLVLRPVIGDPAHDLLRVVSTRKGTFGIRPICFGLAPVSGRDAPRGLLRFVESAPALGRVFVHHEVAELVDLLRFLNRTNKKSVVIFPVSESRHAKHAGNVGCGGVSAKLFRQRAKQGFGLRPIEAVYAPDNLIFFRRGVEHEIRNGNISSRSNGVKRRRAVFVKIEIDVTNLKDAFLGPRMAVMPERIHSEKNVGTTFASLTKPILKGKAGDDFRGKNPLHGLAASVVAEEDRDSIFWRVKGEYIFRRGKKAGRECLRLGHACSRGAA